jgi:hypothetical protein
MKGLIMETKKIELLEDRVATLEFTLKQLESQVSRIFGDPGESFQLPTGLVPLESQNHE